MFDLRHNAKPSDAALRELFAVAWGPDFPKPLPDSFAPMLERSRVHITAHLADAHLAGPTADRLVGFVNVVDEGPGEATMFDVLVHPEFRGLGLATRLVLGAKEAARASGVERLRVTFEPHLSGFYRRCGFL